MSKETEQAAINRLRGVLNTAKVMETCPDTESLSLDQQSKQTYEKGWKDAFALYRDKVKQEENNKGIFNSSVELRNMLLKLANLMPEAPEGSPIYISGWVAGWIAYRQTLKRLLGLGGG